MNVALSLPGEVGPLFSLCFVRGGGSLDDNQFKFWMRIIDAVVTIAKVAIPSLCFVWVAKLISDALVAFAGQQTDASIAVNLATSIQLDRWAAWLIAFFAISYGVNQRRLRQINIERLAGKPAELEKRLDNKRTSSGLTPKGTTRKEDK